MDSYFSEVARRAANGTELWKELTAMLRAQEIDVVAMKAIEGYKRGSVYMLLGAGASVDQNTRTKISTGYLIRRKSVTYL
jgi:hypothetical protein